MIPSEIWEEVYLGYIMTFRIQGSLEIILMWNLHNYAKAKWWVSSETLEGVHWGSVRIFSIKDRFKVILGPIYTNMIEQDVGYHDKPERVYI